MRLLILLSCLCFTLSSLNAQFSPTEKGLTIMVTDGTDIGRNSNLQPPNGETIYVDPYKGIYRLIRQKLSPEEEIPNGMRSYRLSGTVYFLGISYSIPKSSTE